MKIFTNLGWFTYWCSTFIEIFSLNILHSFRSLNTFTVTEFFEVLWGFRFFTWYYWIIVSYMAILWKVILYRRYAIWGSLHMYLSWIVKVFDLKYKRSSEICFSKWFLCQISEKNNLPLGWYGDIMKSDSLQAIWYPRFNILGFELNCERIWFET